MDVVTRYRAHPRYMAPDITDADILRLANWTPRLSLMYVAVWRALRSMSNG